MKVKKPVEQKPKVPKPHKPLVWKGMSEAQFKKALDLFSDCAHILRLKEWDFTLSRYPAEGEDVFAEIKCIYGQKRATIFICAEWNSLEPETQMRVAFHELLHAYLDGIDKHLDRVLPELVGANAATAIIDNVHEQIEKAVDAVAEAFTQLKRSK